jgi:hypothetical protein
MERVPAPHGVDPAREGGQPIDAGSLGERGAEAVRQERRRLLHEFRDRCVGLHLLGERAAEVALADW